MERLLNRSTICHFPVLIDGSFTDKRYPFFDRIHERSNLSPIGRTGSNFGKSKDLLIGSKTETFLLHVHSIDRDLFPVPLRLEIDLFHCQPLSLQERPDLGILEYLFGETHLPGSRQRLDLGR